MVKDRTIPFSLPFIGDEEINEVVATLKSGWLTTGKKAAEFEYELKKYTGSHCAVVVSSCTAALHLALKALDIGAGDEVITTPFTFISTIEAIIHVGATPVLVDIQDDTMNIDPEKIDEKITDKTKAILPVHYAGHPCDMDEIFAIAKKYNLKVIEDAAHAIGAHYKGTAIGVLPSDATCFSFYATKNLSTGEGGALLTDCEQLAKHARILSLHGITKDAWARYGEETSWKYELRDIGFKYNLTDIQAVIGIQQLKKLDAMNKARCEHVNTYNEIFGKVKDVRVPQERPYVNSACHLYPLRITSKNGAHKRDTVIEELKRRKIGVSVHFIPACSFAIMQEQFGFKEEDYPVTMKVFSEVLSLPLYSQMESSDVVYVAKIVKEIVEGL
ncbi:DegT/DnrJ/EryC1/StrS family aminotransferase [Candidatus Omnitrophota bacterium]